MKLTRTLPLAFIVLTSLLGSMLAPPAAMAAAGVPDHLLFSQQPTNVQSDASINPAVTVQVLDSDGNLVPDPTTVTVALSGGDAGATLSGTATQATVGGVATFGDLSIDKTGTGYVLTASLPDFSAVPALPSDPFDVTPGAPDSLHFDQQPTNTVAGAVIAPAVTVDVRDVEGNLVTDQSVDVTVALSGGSAGASLGGTTTQPSAAGVATFDDLTVDKTGTAYLLNATAPGVSQGDTSDPFDISAGAGTHVKFDQQPSDVVAGQAIAPSVTVDVLDGQGNLVLDPTDVTVSLSGGDPAATLGGHTTRTSVGGVATFDDLTIDNAASGYTLVASAVGLTSDTSNAFTVSPGEATKLAFTTQPVNTPADHVIPRIEVSVEDSFGNVLTGLTGGKITLVIAHNPSNGHLSGQPFRGVSHGVAAFPGLSIDEPGTGYTLSATGLSLPVRISAPFNIKGDTKVTITASRHFVGYGVHFRLVAHLASCLDTCELTIYRLPAGGTQSVVAAGKIDGQHNLVVAPGPGVNTTYWAEFAGDSRYLPGKSGETKVLVHVLVRDSIRGKGGAGRQGAYQLFHYYKVCAQQSISCPTVHATVVPDKANHTIHFTLQAHVNGRWQTVSTGDNTLDSTSSAALAWVYGGQSVRGVPLRTRAWYRGDKFNGGEAFGPWAYFKVI